MKFTLAKQESKESVSYKQREVISSLREIWVAPITGETLVGSVKICCE